MPDPASPAPSATSGHSPQELLRRRMFRLTLMVSIILTVVAGLVVAAVLMGLDARRQQLRAESAERLSQEQLWLSHRDQASALRRSGLVGRRLEGMAALEKAAEGWRALHASEGGDSPAGMSLREEAVALMALPDLRKGPSVLPVPAGDGRIAVDAAQDLLATADRSNGITVRRLSDGVELARLDRGPAATGNPSLLALEWRPRAPGGTGSVLLGAWYQSGEVAMWSLPEGKKCYTWLPQDGGLNGAGAPPGRFSEDGKYLAYFTAERSPLTIFDLGQSRMVPHGLTPGRRAFAIRPGRTQIAMAAGDTVSLTDFSTGRQLRTWPVSGQFFALTWSRDGTRLAGMTGEGDVVLWSMDTKTAWTLNGHTTQPAALAFSPDGGELMSSSRDGTTRWWDARRGSALLMSREGKGLSWNADGTAIAFESNAGGVGQWQISPAPVLHAISPPTRSDAKLEYYDLSPDGRWLAAITPGGLVLWDTTDLEWPLYVLQRDLRALAFEPSGTLLLMSGDGVLRKTILSGEGSPPQLQVADPPPLHFPAGERLRLMSLSGDGRTLLVEFQSLGCGIADLKGERPFVPLASRLQSYLFRGPGSPTGGGRLAVSPDGRLAAYGYGFNRSTTVFDTGSGRELWNTGSEEGIAQFSPDSQHLLYSTNGAAKLLHAGDWITEARRSLPGQHIAGGALAYSRDTHLVALSTGPQTVQLCRASDLTPLVTLAAPVPRHLNGCRLSHDGARLAVACSGNEVQIWNLRILRQELARLGLDWQDGPLSPAAPAGLPVKSGGVWGLAIWLCGAAIAAAVAAVVMLRRHHGLMRDFASAETLLTVQRQDLENANFSLLHSQKMKALGTMAAGMAHDFNNLLSVIRMSNKLIGRETKGHGEVTELVDSVETAVLQGKQVVSSMLSYSREETGPVRPVVDVVRDAAALLSTEFLSGITLALHLDDTAPAVNVPAGRIEQILLNLIVNASEAMNGSGGLNIAVSSATPQAAATCVLMPHTAVEYVEIAVTDSGPGVPGAIAGRIFEPFFTTKNAGNDRGTGLGLSMVYTIAERDGMGLALRSVPGIGATFSLFIPAATAPVLKMPGDSSGGPD